MHQEGINDDEDGKGIQDFDEDGIERRKPCYYRHYYRFLPLFRIYVNMNTFRIT